MQENEIEQKSGELNSLLVEIVKNQKRNYKTMAVVFVIVVTCMTIIICALVGAFTWYEAQFEYETVATETVEQEVSGDGSSINNVEGNQYNDNAIHNEGD
jgi:flagellar basal body-associated protein FliL